MGFCGNDREGELMGHEEYAFFHRHSEILVLEKQLRDSCGYVNANYKIYSKE